MTAAEQRQGPGVARELAGAIRQLRPDWMAMAGTSLLCSLLATAAVVPVVGLLLRWLVALSGRVAVADVDIVSFLFTTPSGVVALVLISALLVALAAFEQSCMMILALSHQQGAVLRVRAAFALATTRAPAILRLTTGLVIRLLVLLAPFIAVAGCIYWALLREYDINFYLGRRPPAFWAACGLVGLDLLALVAVAGRYLVGWLLALPLVVVARHPPATALAESARRMLGRRADAAALLAAWALLALALSLAVVPVLQALGRAVAPAFGESLPGMLMFSTIVALVWVAASFALAVTTKGLFALITSQYYAASAPADDGLFHSRRWQQSGSPQPMTRRRWGVVVAAIVTIGAAGAFVGHTLMQDSLADRPVLVFAHRGASGAAPENTLAAFRRAGTEHTDYVELDVQETADGVVVVAHDSDLMKVARSPLKIWNSTAAQLRAVDIGSFFSPAYSDQRVPTLAEALAACKGVSHVDIELKDYGHDQRLEERVVELVEAAGMQAQIVTMSLSERMVAKMKQLRPDWTSGMLIARAFGRVNRLPVDFLAVESKMATPGFVRSAHASGKPVYVWTVNDAQRMIRLIGLGADGLITNYPDLARDVVVHYRSASPAERLFLFVMTRLGVREEISEPENDLRP
jgi:glycerophosphoryl diester phosphodiesterase